MESTRSTPTPWWNRAPIFDRFTLSPTMGKRGLAMIIDFGLVSALQFGLAQVFGVNGGWAAGQNNWLLNYDGFSLNMSRFAALPSNWLLIIVLAYFIIFEALFSATPGKALLGLQVVTLDGRRPSLINILMRNVLRLVDTLPFLYIIGGLVAQNTAYEQRVGDIVAHTCVAPRQRLDADLRHIRLLPWKILLVSVLLAGLIGVSGVYQYEYRGPLVIQSWLNLNDNAAGVMPVCGPFKTWPFPNNPDISGSNTFPFETPGAVMEYAVGAPQWNGDTVTYPVRMELWNSAHDFGLGSIAPEQVPLSVVGTAGGDVHDASVTLHWEGPLTGWVMTGGSLAC